MKKIIILFSIFFTASSFARVIIDTSIPISKIFTQQEMRAIGIEKLTNSEKDKLRSIIVEIYKFSYTRNHGRYYDQGFKDGQKKIKSVDVNIPPNPEISRNPVKLVAKKSEPLIIETHVKGKFEGWKGDTIVNLMNGQVWQQDEYSYHYNYSFMPRVVVYKKDSIYKMEVDGLPAGVRVRRLK